MNCKLNNVPFSDFHDQDVVQDADAFYHINTIRRLYVAN